jgi:hypothetical protein
VLARRLVPVLALAAVAGLAAAGCASQSVGVRVGDDTYSQADMVDELDAYGENEELFPPEQAESIRGELADSYSQDFVAELLRQRITFMVAEQVFDDEGLELTEDDRTVAESQLATQFRSQEAVDAFPDAYRERLVDDLARLNILAEELGQDGFNEALVDTVRTSDVEVSPRFGEWDADQLDVAAPVGSTPGPDGSGDQAEPAPLPAG